MLESDRTNNNLNYIINKVSAGRTFVTTTPATTADFTDTKSGDSPSEIKKEIKSFAVDVKNSI